MYRGFGCNHTKTTTGAADYSAMRVSLWGVLVTKSEATNAIWLPFIDTCSAALTNVL